MSEKLTIVGANNCSDFIDGWIFDERYDRPNDINEFEQWEPVEDNIVGTKHSTQYHEVISKRLSDGRYFRGTYEQDYNEGRWPGCWDDNVSMVVTEVFPTFKIVKTFTEEAEKAIS